MISVSQPGGEHGGVQAGQQGHLHALGADGTEAEGMPSAEHASALTAWNALVLVDEGVVVSGDLLARANVPSGNGGECFTLLLFSSIVDAAVT